MHTIFVSINQENKHEITCILLQNIALLEKKVLMHLNIMYIIFHQRLNSVAFSIQ